MKRWFGLLWYLLYFCRHDANSTFRKFIASTPLMLLLTPAPIIGATIAVLAMYPLPPAHN